MRQYKIWTEVETKKKHFDGMIKIEMISLWRRLCSKASEGIKHRHGVAISLSTCNLKTRLVWASTSVSNPTPTV